MRLPATREEEGRPHPGRRGRLGHPRGAQADARVRGPPGRHREARQGGSGGGGVQDLRPGGDGHLDARDERHRRRHRVACDGPHRRSLHRESTPVSTSIGCASASPTTTPSSPRQRMPTSWSRSSPSCSPSRSRPAVAVPQGKPRRASARRTWSGRSRACVPRWASAPRRSRLPAFIAMLGSEIDQLRKIGRSDDDIAALLTTALGRTITARAIEAHS